MTEVTGFFTLMSALSAATQQLVEYLLKKPFDFMDKVQLLKAARSGAT